MSFLTLLHCGEFRLTSLLIGIQLFLEEERERELEELYDSNINDRDRDEMKVMPNGEEVPLDEATEVTKTTTETLMAGEKIMEALELSTLDQAITRAHLEEVSHLSVEQARKVPAPTRNPIFALYNHVGPEQYVLMVVRRIPAASLHDALLVLPFGKVIQLIEHLDFWAEHVRYSLPSPLLPPLLAVNELSMVYTDATSMSTGMANHSHRTRPVFPPSYASFANRCYSITQNDDDLPTASST